MGVKQKLSDKGLSNRTIYQALLAIQTLVNELKDDVDLNGAALAAILTKLDSDSGVNNTNYASIHGRSGSGASIQAAAVAASDVDLTSL